uniref:Uncharacterized protein n=1 Tax=Arundo donax TaxID=35708 RepID=A0A0A9E1R0_ARUDO
MQLWTLSYKYLTGLVIKFTRIRLSVMSYDLRTSEWRCKLVCAKEERYRIWILAS